MWITIQHEVRRYSISAHPYLFDVFFRKSQWCGTGHVVMNEINGGINEARADVDADDEGCRALKTAGFVVQLVLAMSARSE